MRRWVIIVASAFLFCTAPAGASTNDNQCLATAIHYEASGESLDGKRAVYDVIRNRAEALKSSVCGVVKAPGQFSWYGHKPMLPYTREMQLLLDKVKNQTRVIQTEQWFFARYIKTPKWAKRMDCQIIGNHKFCKQGENNE